MCQTSPCTRAEMRRMGGAWRHQKSTRDFLDPDAPVFNQDCHCFGKVVEIRGKGLVHVALLYQNEPLDTVNLSEQNLTLALLPPKFRSALWLRRGAFLLLSVNPTSQHSSFDSSSPNKVTHTIEALLTADHVKQYRKQGIWPIQELEIIQVSEATGISSSDDSSCADDG